MSQHSAQLDINLDMNTKNTLQQLQALERIFARIDKVTKDVSHNVSEIAALDFDKQNKGLSELINKLSSKDANSLNNALNKVASGSSASFYNKGVTSFLEQVNKVMPIFNMSKGAGKNQPTVLSGYGSTINSVISTQDINSKAKITEALKKFTNSLNDAQVKLIDKNFNYVKEGINANLPGDTGRRPLTTFKEGFKRLREMVIQKQNKELAVVQEQAKAQVEKEIAENEGANAERLRARHANIFNLKKQQIRANTMNAFGRFESADDMLNSSFKGFSGEILKSYLIKEGAKAPAWWSKKYTIGTEENNPSGGTINTIAKSMKNMQSGYTGNVQKYIIGLSDAEIALAQNTEASSRAFARQRTMIDSTSNTAKALTAEIDKLAKAEKALGNNTTPQMGFTKQRINEAVSAFTTTPGTSQMPKGVAGVPFWIKDYYKNKETGRIFFSEAIAEKSGEYTKHLNPIFGNMGETNGFSGQKIKPFTIISKNGGMDADFIPNFQETIYDKMAAGIRGGDMSSFGNIRTMLKYQGQSGMASTNILANPTKFAEDFERNISSRFTVYGKVLDALGIGGDTASNPYKKLIEQFQSAARNKDGSMKSANELKSLFTSREFTDIYLKRAKSNISTFEKTVLEGLTTAQKEAIAQEIGRTEEFGLANMVNGDPRKLYTGKTRTMIQSVSAQGGVNYFPGTEKEFLYNNYNINQVKATRDAKAEAAKATPIFERMFDTKRTETYTGALNNLRMRIAQVGQDIPNILQTLNLSYTKAAFAISRVAYGVRIISMEMMAMGMTAKNTFVMMLRNVVSYTDAITKATETQQKARITLTGVFNAKKADQMVEFAKAYSVTSPATFGEVTQMLKSFGLTPQIKNMINDSKDLTKTLKDLSYVTIGLASTKPQQGIDGAMFAIREAMSGQFVSMKRRFEISPEVIASMVGKNKSDLAKDPKMFMTAMQKFLDLNVGEDTLAKLAMTYQVQLNNIKDFMEQAQAIIGQSGFYDLAVKSANRIADAFAGILNTEHFRGQLKEISGSLMSITDSVVNGISNTINRVVKMDKTKEGFAAEDIRNNLLKGGGKFTASEMDARIKYGLSLMRITNMINLGFTVLAHTTEQVVEWFNKLTDGLVLDEKVITYYVGIISELVEGFVNLGKGIIGLYASYVKWISSLKLSNDFLKGALLMMGMFPIATMNIAINTFRALFESILALSNPMVWASISKLGLNLRQLTGELVNTVAAAVSLKGTQTELGVLFGGLPIGNTYVTPMGDAIEEMVSVKKKIVTSMGDEILQDVLIPASSMTKFGNRMKKGMISTFMYGFTGFRAALIIAIGAIVTSAIAEGIGEKGNTGIKAAVLRVAGLFSFINNAINNLFGTGWLGAIIKNGGILAMMFPVKSYNIGAKMIGGIKKAFDNLMESPSMIKWYAMLGLAITAAGLAYKAGSDYEGSGGKTLVGAISEYDKYKTARTQLSKNEANPSQYGSIANTSLRNIVASFEDKILNSVELSNAITVQARKEGLFRNRNIKTMPGLAIPNIGGPEVLTHETFKKLDKAFLERTLKKIGGDDTVSVTESLKQAFTHLAPGADTLEKEGTEFLGSYANAFDILGTKTTSTFEDITKAFTKAKEKINSMLKPITEEPKETNPLKDMLKAAMQSEQSLNASLLPVQDVIDKYKKEDKGYAVKEVNAIIDAYNKLSPQVVAVRAEVYAMNTAVRLTTNEAFNLYDALQKFSGLSFVVPIMLQLQMASNFMPSIPVVSGMASGILQNAGNNLKTMFGVLSWSYAKAGKDDRQIKNDLADTAKRAAEKGGGADKAADQFQKYESIMKSLEKEILDSQDRQVEARIRAAEHEKKQKLSEVEEEFKGTKYLEILKTKVVEAEAAKRAKIETDIRRELYSKIADSKFSSTESVMKAYGWLQEKDRTKQINDITDALKNNIISQGVYNELINETNDLYKTNMLEKYYETLKKQPKLVDILGGKDAEKILDSFNVKLASYVKISEKQLSLVNNSKVAWDLIDTTKVKTGSGTETTKTYQLMGKTPGSAIEGDTASATRTAMEALRTAYYQNSVNMLKMEIEQEKKLSQVQMDRMSNDDFYKRFGMTKEYATTLRDIIDQTRILAQAEEQYYKMKEQKMQQTASISEQMNYAITEQVRKLPSQYDVVKSGTESMFNTLKDGLSNTLSAAFSGDVEKMKDSWKEFLTTIKNTFLKMISDLIVNNLMKSLFSGLMGKEETEKQGFLQNVMNTGKSGLMNILPGLSVPNPADMVKTIADPLTMASTTTASTLMSGLTPAIGVATTALGTFTSALAYSAQMASAKGVVGDGGSDGFFGMLGDIVGIGSSDGSYTSGGATSDYIGMGGYTAGYATGGIVSAPTMAMIGEGGQNEAVVPLPNGRAIPVDMKGNSNSSQNLTIINIVDASILDEFIASRPDAVINVIASDTMHGGKTYQAQKAKSGR